MVESREEITGWLIVTFAAILLHRGLSSSNGCWMTELALMAADLVEEGYDGVPTAGRLRCWMTGMPPS